MMGSVGSSDSHQNQKLDPAFRPVYNDLANKAMIASAQGYTPYMGADVAAFNPQQIAGMQQANDWSAAFNNPGQKAAQVTDSLMPAQDFGNGMRGYSSYGGYMDQLENLKKTYPGMFAYIQSQAINPVTGRLGSRAYLPQDPNLSAPSQINSPFPGGSPGGSGPGNQTASLLSADRSIGQPSQTREQALFGGSQNGQGGLNSASGQDDLVTQLLNYFQYNKILGSRSSFLGPQWGIDVGNMVHGAPYAVAPDSIGASGGGSGQGWGRR